MLFGAEDLVAPKLDAYVRVIVVSVCVAGKRLWWLVVQSLKWPQRPRALLLLLAAS